MTKMIGICGDDCLSCPRYAATQSGSPEELEEARKLWVKLGLRDPAFPLQEMACYGCKPENKWDSLGDHAIWGSIPLLLFGI